jgi:hypothetical protein
MTHRGAGGAGWRDMRWHAMGGATSPELRSGRSGARRLGFTSSKWSGGKGDPYLRVLGGESGS